MNSTKKPSSSAKTQADSLEPLLGATLCLMTHWLSHRDTSVANKIICNLDALAADQHTSVNFKRVCCRLRDRWYSMQSLVCPTPPEQPGRHLH